MKYSESLIDPNLAPKLSTLPVLAAAPINIVVLAESDSIKSGIGAIAQRNGWRIRPCSTLREAIKEISHPSDCVVLSESRIGDTSWRDVLAYLHRCTPPVPLIVFAKFADENLWVDVLDAGGFDVVLFPFEEHELVRVLNSAHPKPRTCGAAA